jgi:hypothetical protein
MSLKNYRNSHTLPKSTNLPRIESLRVEEYMKIERGLKSVDLPTKNWLESFKNGAYRSSECPDN